MDTENNKAPQYWINLAQQIAAKAHDGQFRRDKKTPYINHPIAVAKLVEERLKPVALLHDVPEDTSVTLEDLKNAGFPPYIIVAVDLLTHRANVTNMDYWKGICANPDAAIVKIADIKCNLGDAPTDQQVRKYRRALEVFAAAGYSV